MGPLEVRIGNFITDEWASASKMFAVKQFNDKIVQYGEYKCNWINARGITLLPEHLLKFGFTKSSSKSELWSYRNTMIIWRTEYELDMLDNYYEFRFGITSSYGAHRQVRLDYIHQLQNLTFILTGEELQYNKDEVK